MRVWQQKILAAAVPLAVPSLLSVCAVPSLAAQQAPSLTYYEFGTVVALGKRTVDIQTFNLHLNRVVQHSFSLSREARIDLVHVGDSVEVFYQPTSPEWTLRRLVVLADGMPVAGPPSGGPASPAGAVASGTLAGAPPPTLSPGTVPPASSTRLANPNTASGVTPRQAKNGKAASAKASTPPPPAGPAVGAGARALPAAVATAPGAALPVTAITPQPPRSKDFAVTAPSDGCRRSDPDWPSEPMRIAVIDFRYPTEREEAHDIGSTGGGSGTAVADLVFNRLSGLATQDSPEDIAYSRGDRRRLDKTDFAGAARIGRQLGVDAVLAGTFFPVETPAVQYGEPVTVKTYELRAGLVDTCTGALLLRLASVACPTALEPGFDSATQPDTCKRLAVSPGEAANPKSETGAFQPLLDAMLYPLEHDGKPPTQPAPALGTVTSASGTAVSVQLAPHSAVHVGDSLSLHSWRLAKNPTTYTLQNVSGNEIGRMQVDSVQGSTVRGTYQGDIPPRPGDTAAPAN